MPFMQTIYHSRDLTYSFGSSVVRAQSSEGSRVGPGFRRVRVHTCAKAWPCMSGGCFAKDSLVYVSKGMCPSAREIISDSH